MRDISPLSSEERSIALKVALGHHTLKPHIGERYRAVLVTVALDRKQPEGSRQAVVGVYNYTNNRTVIAAVDLRAKDVLAVERTHVQFQLDPEEEREAAELTGQDDRVKAFLAGRAMNPLTRLYFPPNAGRHDPPHRYAIVFQRPSKNERRFAVVDLSDRKVVDFLSSDQYGPQ